jgi:succinate-acetate transporter protein
MKTFVKSGGAFMVVALLCFAAGLRSESGAVFNAVGAFWLVMAIVVRAKNSKKQAPPDQP